MVFRAIIFVILGFGRTPPPYVGKNSQKMSFFLTSPLSVKTIFRFFSPFFAFFITYHTFAKIFINGFDSSPPVYKLYKKQAFWSRRASLNKVVEEIESGLKPRWFARIGALAPNVNTEGNCSQGDGTDLLFSGQGQGEKWRLLQGVQGHKG